MPDHQSITRIVSPVDRHPDLEEPQRRVRQLRPAEPNQPLVAGQGEIQPCGTVMPGHLGRNEGSRLLAHLRVRQAFVLDDYADGSGQVVAVVVTDGGTNGLDGI